MYLSVLSFRIAVNNVFASDKNYRIFITKFGRIWHAQTYLVSFSLKQIFGMNDFNSNNGKIAFREHARRRYSQSVWIR